MILFGIVGYLMKKYDYEPAPLVLAFLLEPMFENAFRQSLIISRGSPTIFLTRPISAAFILITFFLLLSPLVLRALGKRRPGLLVKEE
jgi:putative tricarboxylic transport membrane protein